MSERINFEGIVIILFKSFYFVPHHEFFTIRSVNFFNHNLLIIFDYRPFSQTFSGAKIGRAISTILWRSTFIM